MANRMIDHDYKIVTREVARTASRIKHFVAKLTHVYIIVDGERKEATYPQQEFSAKSEHAAMILASNAFRRWLENQYPIP